MAVQVRVALKYDAPHLCYYSDITWHVWLQMEASGLLEASVQQIPIMTSPATVEKPDKITYGGYKRTLF